MTDFHTHILPHIDDGAKDSKTSQMMMQKELEQGVKRIVLTPHYYGKRRNIEQFLEKREQCFQHIRAIVPETVDVYMGAEVHFTGVNMPDFDELAKLAIGDTQYILFELPFTTVWSSALLARIHEFIDETGYTPIIAHVERYQDVLKKPALVSTFINMGCLIQVNTRAFTDKMERKLAFALLKKGQIHCLGSDTHDNENRAPDWLTAKQAFEKAGQTDRWDEIQDNMQTILNGGRIDPPYAKPVKKIFGSYH